MVRAMKPTSRKRRVLRRFALVFAVCFAAYAIAAMFNPSLLSVPAKVLVGEAGLTFRVGTVHGSINGSPISYDAYREVLSRGADLRFHGLLLTLQSGDCRQHPFEQLLVGRDMILLPGNVDIVKLPFGVLLMETANGVEISSKKAFDDPSLVISTDAGVRQYRFTNHNRDNQAEDEFELFVPTSYAPLSPALRRRDEVW